MPDAAPLTHEDCAWLLGLARRTLERLPESGSRAPAESDVAPPPIPEAVRRHSGVFVTLRIGDTLRGCIGYVAALMPLYRAVIENTVHAARSDPRFPPVSREETAEITIEISVMSPPRKVESVEEIEVGLHGLVVSRGTARGLLLPQVATECGWDRETFLSQTCWKAGLPREAWRKGGVAIEVFTAQVFSEREKRPPSAER
jgi:AmmeMemoRadiSam system protein A